MITAPRAKLAIQQNKTAVAGFILRYFLLIFEI
nr:unnamed protein product [Callosobruchus analis]